MYTETNKGFTIITNFGCDCNCKYCITRYHPILQNQITDESAIHWNYLEQCIASSDAPTVNLSGGGDPFYQWKHHKDFYHKVHDLAHKYGKGLDIHTRILPNDADILSLFRKIALSIEYRDEQAISDLGAKIDFVQEYCQLRVINVLDKNMSKFSCQDYIDTMKFLGVEQITFRQMFGNRQAAETFESIRGQINEPGVMFLPDGEYHNYYFTTNNTLYPYFFGYSEADRAKWKAKYENIEQSCS